MVLAEYSSFNESFKYLDPLGFFCFAREEGLCCCVKYKSKAPMPLEKSAPK